MKKLIITLCLFSFGLNCNALELFPYQGMSNVQTINGTIKTNGCNDVITIPSSQSFNIIDEFRSPTAGSILPAVLLASDPYIVPIDGVNYVMIKDKKTIILFNIQKRQALCFVLVSDTPQNFV